VPRWGERDGSEIRGPVVQTRYHSAHHATIIPPIMPRERIKAAIKDLLDPGSFAGGRYKVREFPGEGGNTRFFPSRRERITREAQAMGRPGDHPHIVPALDHGQEHVNGASQLKGFDEPVMLYEVRV
jgi:hypothetical protein